MCQHFAYRETVSFFFVNGMTGKIPNHTSLQQTWFKSKWFMKLIFVLDCSERCRRDQEAFGDREGRLGEAAGRRREHDEEPLKTQNFTQHSGTSHTQI